MSTSAVDPSLPVSIYLVVASFVFSFLRSRVGGTTILCIRGNTKNGKRRAFVSSAAGSAGVGEVDSTPRPYGKDLL